MKKIIIIALSILCIGCKAQGTITEVGEIVNITDKNGTRVNGAYYKDVDNLLNQFEGTYVYSSGTKMLKIQLVKKTMQSLGAYYEDLIIGEYQYIEDGVEKVNTLPQINIVYAAQRAHSIRGNTVLNNNNKPRCNDCEPLEKRLRLGFSDAVESHYGSMIVRKINVGGSPAIKIHLKRVGTTDLWIDGQPEPPNNYSMPSGEFILIKQP